MRHSSNLERTFLKTHIEKFSQNAQARSSLEEPLKYNQDQTLLANQGQLRPSSSTWELQEYFTVSDQVQNRKYVKRYLSHREMCIVNFICYFKLYTFVVANQIFSDNKASIQGLRQWGGRGAVTPQYFAKTSLLLSSLNPAT